MISKNSVKKNVYSNRVECPITKNEQFITFLVAIVNLIIKLT